MAFSARQSEKSELKVQERAKVIQLLDDMRHHRQEKNWMVFKYTSEQYGKRDELACEATGAGGLEKAKAYFGDNDVKFGVVEVVVKGDKYNPVKYILITWIGPKVSAGLHKARSAGHRPQLVAFIKKHGVGISAEYQADSLADLDYENIAQKVMQRRQEVATTVTAERSDMSRSHAVSGDTKTSGLVVSKTIDGPLRELYGRTKEWVLMAYAGRDELTFVEAGSTGLDAIKKFFDPSSIKFCMYALTYRPTGYVDDQTKFILISLVGENAPPLQKARSGGHRQTLIDYVGKFGAVHTQFQPESPEDIFTKNITSKFK